MFASVMARTPDRPHRRRASGAHRARRSRWPAPLSSHSSPRTPTSGCWPAHWWFGASASVLPCSRPWPPPTTPSPGPPCPGDHRDQHPPAGRRIPGHGGAHRDPRHSHGRLVGSTAVTDISATQRYPTARGGGRARRRIRVHVLVGHGHHRPRPRAGPVFAAPSAGHFADETPVPGSAPPSRWTDPATSLGTLLDILLRHVMICRYCSQ